MSYNEINKLVNKARETLQEAESIADASGQSFEFSLGYGMGGTYYPVKPKKLTKREAIALLNSGKQLTEEDKAAIVGSLDEEASSDNDWNSSYEGWVSSSAQC